MLSEMGAILFRSQAVNLVGHFGRWHLSEYVTRNNWLPENLKDPVSILSVKIVSADGLV